MSKFAECLKQGVLYEKKAMKFFTYDTIEHKTGYFKDYDFSFKKDNTEMRVEVKSDKRASQTGNICVEYSYRKKPSGISGTKADIWVHFVVGKDCEDAYIIPVKDLKKIVKDCRIVKSGDYGKAYSYLIPIWKISEYLHGDKKMVGSKEDDFLNDLIGDYINLSM